MPYLPSEPDVVTGVITNLFIDYVLFAIGFIRFKPKTSKLEQSNILRL